MANWRYWLAAKIGGIIGIFLAWSAQITCIFTGENPQDVFMHSIEEAMPVFAAIERFLGISQ